MSSGKGDGNFSLSLRDKLKYSRQQPAVSRVKAGINKKTQVVYYRNLIKIDKKTAFIVSSLTADGRRLTALIALDR